MVIKYTLFFIYLYKILVNLHTLVTTFRHAAVLWWQELTPLVLLNCLWVFCQLALLPAPAATAALAFAAHQLHTEGEIEFRAVWHVFRGLFWRAWGWGALNVLIYTLLLGNLWLSLYQPQPLWVLLRPAWAVMAFGWFTVNLFFWSFWFQSPQPTAVSVLRQSAQFSLKFLGTATLLSAFLLLLGVFSAAVTFFLVTAWATWLALVPTILLNPQEPETL
ncbi:MAG: hypothetical protein OHK0052_18140 [Anaerolineales bacterium]